MPEFGLIKLMGTPAPLLATVPVSRNVTTIVELFVVISCLFINGLLSAFEMAVIAIGRRGPDQSEHEEDWSGDTPEEDRTRQIPQVPALLPNFRRTAVKCDGSTPTAAPRYCRPARTNRLPCPRRNLEVGATAPNSSAASRHSKMARFR